jgi:hypothetical protein
MPDASLAWMIQLYAGAFLVAVAACLSALWSVHRYRWGASMPAREIQHTVAVLVFALAALIVAGVTTSLLVFRLPGSPLFLVRAGIAGSVLLVVLIGGILVLQAVARSFALRVTQRRALRPKLSP